MCTAEQLAVSEQDKDAQQRNKIKDPVIMG